MRGGAHTILWSAFFTVSSILNATPWDEATIGLFNESHGAFVEALGTSPEQERRSLRFGEAVTLLNVQPRTEGNIDKARQIFEEVRAAGSADDMGVESWYLLGRIEQVHRPSPDLAKAESIFRELTAAHPAHPAAQRARVKLAVLRLYAQVDEAERRRRYEEFTANAKDLTDPSAKVQMHFTLAEVARRFKYGHAEELAHLVAADQTGVVKRSLQIQVMVRAGDLARLTGQNELARSYYTRFLEQYPRTDRRSTIEGYLAALN